jgi:hypothetical protein
MTRRRSSSPPQSTAAKAVRHAFRAQEAATAAASVIAARMEMACAALSTPNVEAMGEATAMVTEKMLAFSEAGAAVSGRSGQMAARQVHYAMDETERAGAAVAKLATCKTPMDLAMTQSQLTLDFFTRSFAHGMSMGAMALRTGEAGLRPIHRTVTANARRLKTR